MFYLNTNYHELSMNSKRRKINGQLHGNYMFKERNTNYHELFINYRRQQDYMINYMAIICLR